MSDTLADAAEGAHAVQTARPEDQPRRTRATQNAWPPSDASARRRVCSRLVGRVRRNPASVEAGPGSQMILEHLDRTNRAVARPQDERLLKRLEPVVARVHPDNDVVEGHHSKR